MSGGPESFGGQPATNPAEGATVKEKSPLDSRIKQMAVAYLRLEEATDENIAKEFARLQYTASKGGGANWHDSLPEGFTSADIGVLEMWLKQFPVYADQLNPHVSQEPIK